jgi:hypothetical protein
MADHPAVAVNDSSFVRNAVLWVRRKNLGRPVFRDFVEGSAPRLDHRISAMAVAVTCDLENFDEV